MTNFNKATLATFFQNGDVPQGTDYTNLINSQVNLVETVEQDMAGPLSTTKLITPRVSAGALNVTSTLSAQNINISGTFSLVTLNATNVKATSVSASNIAATKVSAQTFYNGITIISAAGTTQATAGPITAAIGICRLQGTADGQATGYLLPTPTSHLGLEQTIIHEGAVSGNLWPNVGCKINALSNNAAFALAANVPYYVTYSQVSGYAVK